MRAKILLLATALGLTQMVSAQSAKSVILVYLDGGPAQTETFDPKPDAGRDYYGLYKDAAIDTNVEGIQIGKMLPELAKVADKYAILRSMTHGVNGHETGHYAMITGDLSKGSIVYPSFGSVISYMKRDSYKGVLPSYISVTQANSRFNEGGFLGNSYKSFDTAGAPENKTFEVAGIVNPQVDEKKLRGRMELLNKFETRDIEKRKIDSLRSINMDFIWGDSRKVFDLNNESEELRNRYGMTRIGQACLTARRLVEAGVPFVNVRTTGWDSHKKHFLTMNKMLPELDNALSALLIDLDEKGLLESTIVICGGEFGRTPKVMWEAPWNGGRGHFGAAFSYLLAGGGLKGGVVIGETDKTGEKVTERPVYPADMIATIYRQLGIDPKGTLPHISLGELPILPSFGVEGQSNGILDELIKK
ncbi:MAG: DUF1501 domain-containing protein [Rikenellaceae bacterium]